MGRCKGILCQPSTPIAFRSPETKGLLCSCTEQMRSVSEGRRKRRLQAGALRCKARARRTLIIAFFAAREGGRSGGCVVVVEGHGAFFFAPQGRTATHTERKKMAMAAERWMGRAKRSAPPRPSSFLAGFAIFSLSFLGASCE